MMKLGLISLLLTVSEVPISKICISHSVANSFLPCEDPLESVEPAVASATQTSPPYSDDRPIDDDDDDDQNYCESMVIY
ncbi:hypothetical protein TIFTF001_048537 [Ficus carica]|uniref:Secreted protein n=1 Tax=Ficus carica TaxID=3494 RepID=A0AA87YNQ4_FICCA|nr:hypothetical protein TIFTF001_048537 [Ficus carica]